MSVVELIEPVRAGGGAVTLPVVERWSQGRTLYGGASTLVAYTAATRTFPDLPPLRAAQVGFIAPVGSEVELSSTIIRQGRNVTQVQSEIRCEGRLALTALFLFGSAREGNAVHRAPRPADWPAPAAKAEGVMAGKGPAFIRNNFEVRRAQETRGAGDPVMRRWVRLLGADGIDPISQLVLMGDVLPAGAIRAMQRPGPISSMNWSFNLLEVAPHSEDGWWLAENASQHAEAGYSSERLRLWNSDGRQMLDGMQNYAIFG